jgi:hypothetical protein
MRRWPGFGMAWAGYVEVPAGHPAHGLSPNHYDYTVDDVLSGKAAREAPAQKALGEINEFSWSRPHFPDEESTGTWWFAFDCDHAGDLTPKEAEEGRWSGPKWEAHFKQFPEQRPLYHTFEMVKARVEGAAEKLAAMQLVVIHQPREFAITELLRFAQRLDLEAAKSWRAVLVEELLGREHWKQAAADALRAYAARVEESR